MYINKKDLNTLQSLFSIEPQLVTYGLFFGFPICCIKEFICIPFNERKHYKKGEHTGTGYIPCSQCIKPANENWTLFKGLIQKRRIYSAPFPKDEDHISVNYFFIYLTKIFQVNIFDYVDYFHRYEEVLKILKNNNYENELKYFQKKLKYYKKKEKKIFNPYINNSKNHPINGEKNENYIL